MPELPEVETVRRGLEKHVVGRRVERVEAPGVRTVRRQGALELESRLTGRRILDARRRGKYLALGLDDGAALVAHLRMSGQLLYVTDPSLERIKHTHVVIGFEDGSELRFIDPRTFGEVYVTDELDDRGWPADLARLGVDPLADGFEPARLKALLARRRAPLKVVLMDQRVIAGIGNLYADEICFGARVRPDRPAMGVGAAAIRRLSEATLATLQSAIDARGSSLRDAQYRDLMGELGAYQLSHSVYGREGEPCPNCGRPIVRTRLGGRSAFFCRRCQR